MQQHIGIAVANGAATASAPAYPMRGHQLAFRAISDSYDGWSVAEMQQYIRDLVLFGVNQIELVAPDGKPVIRMTPPADKPVEKAREKKNGAVGKSAH